MILLSTPLFSHWSIPISFLHGSPSLLPSDHPAFMSWVSCDSSFRLNLLSSCLWQLSTQWMDYLVAWFIEMTWENAANRCVPERKVSDVPSLWHCLSWSMRLLDDASLTGVSWTWTASRAPCCGKPQHNRVVQARLRFASAVLHCKEKMPKIGSKYSQERNIGASVLISTFMCLWANYIFPRWSCRFCWRKYVDRSWEYINRSQTHECGNWGWGRAIPRKGIYKRNCRCSVSNLSHHKVILSWEYINRSQTHECGNWGWGRAIPRKGIYKRNCRCSVSNLSHHKVILSQGVGTHRSWTLYLRVASSKGCINSASLSGLRRGSVI
jgi:hypothetical protein